MALYAIKIEDTNTASPSPTTIGYFVNGATAPSRMKLNYLNIGSDGTPDDQAADYRIRRITAENATPGGTVVTPEPLDFNERAANSNAVSAPSGEPTYAGTVPSGIYLAIGLNQRATWQWVPMPGREFVCDNANDNGFGLEVEAVTTAWNCIATMHYEE